jgi:putative ATP-dependent endonuclease of OLD family
MRIVSLSIERFRCIEKLDWKIDGRSACLIGQGDSGKTTILDAIDFVLSPRWTLNLEALIDSRMFLT